MNKCAATVVKLLRRCINKKILLHLALAVVLSTCGSGCCTYLLVDSTKYTTNDTFYPSAVYQGTNRQSFALEGTRFEDSTDHGQANASHIFVIMPKEKLVPTNLRTNNTLCMGDIQTLQPNHIGGLKTKDRLPANYEMMADLSHNNNTSLVLKEHHPGRFRYVFLPATVAVDVATSPFQILCAVLVVGDVMINGIRT